MLNKISLFLKLAATAFGALGATCDLIIGIKGLLNTSKTTDNK